MKFHLEDNKRKNYGKKSLQENKNDEKCILTGTRISDIIPLTVSIAISITYYGLFMYTCTSLHCASKWFFSVFLLSILICLSLLITFFKTERFSLCNVQMKMTIISNLNVFCDRKKAFNIYNNKSQKKNHQ